ncbi:hypothetical protein [Pleionea sediminis]|uniref:hypothetical protein n=1 Tax=Pleionea sediminis TaxID=2569479 RepID=UPI001185FBB1|nr:hypothetical protein [Pleionea sediminis]
MNKQKHMKTIRLCPSYYWHSERYFQSMNNRRLGHSSNENKGDPLQNESLQQQKKDDIHM